MKFQNFKPKKIRPKVLFVDDDPKIHEHALRVSKRLGLQKRTAYSPEEANRKIAIRLRAISKLIEILNKKRAASRTALQKEVFTERIRELRRLKENPFALVVSDINMPRGQPTGPSFVRRLKDKLPNQKILMHSDDYKRLADLEAEGFKVSEKNDTPNGRDELREGIQDSLKPKKSAKKW